VVRGLGGVLGGEVKGITCQASTRSTEAPQLPQPSPLIGVPRKRGRLRALNEGPNQSLPGVIEKRPGPKQSARKGLGGPDKLNVTVTRCFGPPTLPGGCRRDGGPHKKGEKLRRASNCLAG